MNSRFSPIVPERPEPRAPLKWIPNFGHRDMDETSIYAQTMPRPAVPADTDDVFSQDEDYDDALDVRELLAQRPAPTPNGKWVALAMDACAQIVELQRLIGELNFFSPGDTGLGQLQRQAEKAKEVLLRAGMKGVL